MKKMYCLIIVLLLCFSFFTPLYSQLTISNAITEEVNYQIYEGENLLFERPLPKVGDIIITKDFSQYEIYLVDQTNYKAKARKINNFEKPKITKKPLSNISTENKKISLYMTHNDESYLDGDGTDSYYGAGGIHDVTKRLAYHFKQKGVNIVVDETLHIPHNSSAYTRSKTTALKLLKDNPNALFDIHRDGVSRSAYAVKVDGKERCQIRIVVGQANPNKDKNLQFAKYLMSVAEVICPWLFCDIYYASGNYNQNLYEKALLFEMGTYTMEKDLVMESVPELVNVICTTLFATSIDQDGNLTIGELNNENLTLDQYLDQSNKNNSNTSFVVWAVLIVVFCLAFVIFFVIKHKKGLKA